MKTILRFLLAFLTVSTAQGLFGPAVAEQSSCAAYVAALEPDKSGVAAVVPEPLLADRNQATLCLIDALRRLGERITSVEEAENPVISLPLLSATSALRRIIASINGGSEQNYDASRLRDFINQFRAEDDVNVISALSYAARSGDRDLRLNAVLILGNVIDNSTVCVPLAHLNDRTLLETPAGKNGRANLLGVVSVVAPWAYQENFDGISDTIDGLELELGGAGDSLQTYKILNNVKERLATQQTTSGLTNKDAPLQRLDNGASSKECGLYIEKMRPRLKLESFGRLKY